MRLGFSLTKHAGADVNARDVTGWPPLHAPAFKANREIIRLLLEHGAVAEPSTWLLESPWVMAEELGFTDIVPLLQQAEWQRTVHCDRDLCSAPIL